MQIKIKKIENGKLPEYKTEGSAGADCYARIKNDIVIKPGASETIPLGFAVEIPMGYEMQIRGRSGLARKNNIDCFPGTIDSDYRGEVCAIILNKGREDFVVKPLDRIAQAVIAPVITANWYLTDNLSETQRGENGFGSTGVKMEDPHEVEKFYEPFTKIAEAENILGCEVVVDNVYKAIFQKVVQNGLKLTFDFKVIGATNENVDLSDMLNHEININSIMAFERVKIHGHRFGKEIEFE